MKLPRLIFIIGFPFLISCKQEAKATGLTISFEQSGSDTVITASGVVDITNLSFLGDFNDSRSEIGSNSSNEDRVWSGLLAGDDVYLISTPYDLFDFGFFEAPANATGDRFGIFTESGINAYLYFENGFAGGTINGQLTVPNTNLNDLDITPHAYAWGPGSSQSFQITPEPGTTFFLAIGIGTSVMRRSRSKQIACSTATSRN